MKVVKPAVDLQTWSLPYTCPHCSSKVEIEATDISYDFHTKEPPWLVSCCLCDFKFRIDEEGVPKLVQADVRKNRYIKHPDTSVW